MAEEDNEVSLADQMKLWEQDELRKMQEDGLSRQSPFTQWRTVTGTVEEDGLDLGRLFEELRGLGNGWVMDLQHAGNQVGAGWQADEWIQT
jgi:hypothetical protein